MADHTGKPGPHYCTGLAAGSLLDYSATDIGRAR